MVVRLAVPGAMAFAMLAAAFAARRHVLATVHPTVAVAVGAAVHRHGVALMLARLALLGGTVLVMTGLLALRLMLSMAAMVGRRRRLGSGGSGDDERRGGKKIFHVYSPEIGSIE